MGYSFHLLIKSGILRQNRNRITWPSGFCEGCIIFPRVFILFLISLKGSGGRAVLPQLLLLLAVPQVSMGSPWALQPPTLLQAANSCPRPSFVPRGLVQSTSFWFAFSFECCLKNCSVFFRDLFIYGLGKKDSIDLVLPGNIFVFQRAWYSVF